MRAAGQGLLQLWTEARLLLWQTFGTLGKLSVPILSLLGLGWAANELSTLLGAEVSCGAPWLVIPIISVCVVVQLACILAVLRLTAVHLGMPDLLSRAAGPQDEVDERDTSPAHLMSITLLPFVGLYSGFGFLDLYARQLVVLSTYRCGPGLMGALQPSTDDPGRGINLYLLLGTLIGLFLLRLVLDVVRERVRRPLVPAMLQIAVETILAFILLLGGFRLFEMANLWFGGTTIHHLWVGWLAAWHDALPAALAAGWDAAWEFWSSVIWPVVMDGAVQPFLWLAMGGLVFGSRLLSLADLWFIEKPTRAVERPLSWLTRLQQSTETARGLRLVGNRGAALLLGDVEEKLLPAWQSLRLVLHAGWPFLAAFTIVFALLDLAQSLPELLFSLILGGHPVWYWVRILPFQDLLVQVFVMSVVWVMLAVAYTRGLSIFAERSGKPELGALLRPGPIRKGPARGRGGAITAVLTAAVLVAALGAVPRSLEADLRSGKLDEPVALNEARLAIGTPRVARSIELFAQTTDTNLIFVVVPVVAECASPHDGSYQFKLRAGDRSYDPFMAAPLLVPAGFQVGREVVFEIQPTDLEPDTELIVQPVEFVSGYQQWVSVPLGLSDSTVLPVTEVAEGTYREAA